MQVNEYLASWKRRETGGIYGDSQAMKVIGTVHDKEIFVLDSGTVGIRQLPEGLMAPVHIGIDELASVVQLLQLAADQSELWSAENEAEYRRKK